MSASSKSQSIQRVRKEKSFKTGALEGILGGMTFILVILVAGALGDLLVVDPDSAKTLNCIGFIVAIGLSYGVMQVVKRMVKARGGSPASGKGLFAGFLFGGFLGMMIASALLAILLLFGPLLGNS